MEASEEGFFASELESVLHVDLKVPLLKLVVQAFPVSLISGILIIYRGILDIEKLIFIGKLIEGS